MKDGFIFGFNVINNYIAPTVESVMNYKVRYFTSK